jgi:hypothetical protein
VDFALRALDLEFCDVSGTPMQNVDFLFDTLQSWPLEPSHVAYYAPLESLDNVGEDRIQDIQEGVTLLS